MAIVGAAGGYGNYGAYNAYGANNGYGAQAQPAQPAAPPAPPATPPKDEKDYDNGHDYYVDLMKFKLSTANSPQDIYNVAMDVMQKMEDNKTDDGKDISHHIQEEANDHEHKRTRQDLMQAVATALQAKGVNAGAWAGQDPLAGETDNG
jgi:hypothetical protein